MPQYELNDSLRQFCRRPGDEGLNATGVQGTRALRRFRKEFRAELDTVANVPCPLHHHDPPLSRAQCLAVRLWDLAQSGDCRWATSLLLLRWQGRIPLNIDVQQHTSIDLTIALDADALQRYRHLVTHEATLSPEEATELSDFRTRTALPEGGDHA